MIGGWASTIPDTYFVKGALNHCNEGRSTFISVLDGLLEREQKERGVKTDTTKCPVGRSAAHRAANMPPPHKTTDNGEIGRKAAIQAMKGKEDAATQEGNCVLLANTDGETIDLREYRQLIERLIADEDVNDKNWSWTVQSVTQTTVHIRWGYLDYLEERKNCFLMVMHDEGEGGKWLFSQLTKGETIECHLVVKGTPNPRIGAEQTIESGIRDAISEISHYAHSRY